MTALWVSAKAAGLATFLSVGVGFRVAYLLARRRFPGKPLIESFVLLPLILPPTVLGYLLLVALGRGSPVGRAWEALTGGPLVFTWLGAAVAASPLFIRQAQVALEEVDPELEAAARAGGASEMRVLFRVSAPLARRGLLAGAVLAFALSLGEFGATLMVAGGIPGRTRTLPLELYEAVRRGDDAQALGLSLLLAAVAAAVSVIATRQAGRRTSPPNH